MAKMLLLEEFHVTLKMPGALPEAEYTAAKRKAGRQGLRGSATPCPAWCHPADPGAGQGPRDPVPLSEGRRGMYPKIIAAIVVIAVIGVLLTGNLGLLVPALLALGVVEQVRRHLKL